MQNIDIYYESIRQVYEQIMKWPRRKQPIQEKIIDLILSVVGGLFTLSVIPILPVLLVVFGSRLGGSLGTFTLVGAGIKTFLVVWGVMFAGGLLLFVLLLWFNDKVDSRAEKPTGPPQTLSPEQLTFIAIYESWKELKIYFVSHVEQHVKNSLTALRRVLQNRHDRLFREIRGGELALRRATIQEYQREEGLIAISMSEDLPAYISESIHPSFRGQVEIARTFLQTFEKYSWFQIDSNTRATLQALISFSEKIPYRLKQKEDLPVVLSVLENLSKFTYAYLPEHKTYMDTTTLEKLRMDGAQCLQQFVVEVNNVTPPSRLQKPDEPKTQSLPFREKMVSFFYGNIFLRFTAWFALILVLTGMAIFIINQRINLSPDAMVTLVIGSSVTGAAALAAFLPVISKK
ncbi:MAG: hypothetical protein HZB51_01570 [Chloroflexi bacterium]|nr:hypothetical protein [Chloroflexota bacterium]